MTYEEAVEARVSWAEARRFINEHNWTGPDGESLFAVFLEENGNHESYQGAVVLDWMGY